MTQRLNSEKNKNSTVTILFDVGGVLLDDFIDSKVVDLAVKYRKDPAEMLNLRKKIRPLADAGKISDKEFWRRILREMGVDAVEEDYQVDDYMHPLAEGMDLVKRLKDRGYKIAILSNDSKEIFKKKRKLFRFDELFDDVIVSNEHGCIKPYVELYQIALRRLHLRPEQAVFIDDRAENLIAPRELGMHTLLYQSAKQAEMELTKLGIALQPNIVA